MTRTELINALAMKHPRIEIKLIEDSVKQIFEQMSMALEKGKRIEIRRFGSFDLRYHEARKGRNPRTGEDVLTQGKYAIHFKPGKELRERVNDTTPVKLMKHSHKGR